MPYGLAPDWYSKLSTGMRTLRLPVRNPSRSRVTNLKPNERKAATKSSAKLGLNKARQVIKGHLNAGHVPFMVANS